MAEVRFPFEQHKLILKWYSKFEKVCEVQRRWRHAALQELMHEIEQSCADIPADTLVDVCHSLVRCCQQFPEANGGHF
jgi:hypothetical protein